MTISADNDRLTVIIPKTLKKELKILADQQNRSISNYVVTILQEHVQRQSYLNQKVAENPADYNK